MADAVFDPAEFAAFKRSQPTPASGPAAFDAAEFGAYKESFGQKATEALAPFYQKGVSTRNSAGQFTPEARAMLTKAGVNPLEVDQKTEKALITKRDEEQQPAGDAAFFGGGSAAIGRGLINGVPVVGPALLSGTNKAAAFLRSVKDGIPYSEALRQVESFNDRLVEKNPIASTVGEVGGGILGTVPLVAAAPAAFGAGAGGLAARSVASGVTGGALGAADSAARSGGDAEEALQGGAIGGGLGLIAPGAGAAIGGAIKGAARLNAAMRPQVEGISNPTARILIEDLKNSGGAAPVRARLAELGDDAMLLDASPSFQGRAQGIAVRPETREAIVNPLEARNAATNERLAAGLDDALGEAPVPSQIEAQFAARRAATGPGYEDALSNGPQVDTSGALAEIGQRLNTAAGAERRALIRARELLTEEADSGIVPRSDPRYLHNAKGALDDLITYGDPTIGVPQGSISREDSALRSVRRKLNEALEAQVPDYASLNKTYSTAARASEALESGKKVLGGGDAALHPEDFAKDIARRPIEQQAALRAGVRADLDRAVGNSANDLQALRREFLSEGDWNRQKLAATFGPEAVDDVARTIDANQTFRDNFANIVKNSQTEQRRQAAEGVAVRDIMPKAGSGVGIAASIGGIPAGLSAAALQALKLGKNVIGRGADMTRNREAARILTMQAGPEREALIDTLNARLTATDQGLIPANQTERFVRQFLQSLNDRSDRRALISAR